MKIAIGADHRGDDASAAIAERLRERGHEIVLYDPCGGASCDYPDKAWPVAEAVRDGRADRGILVCGSGIGVAMAANKVHGIRAALVTDAESTEMSRRHNDANVLCLGADRAARDDLLAWVDLWLTTDFEGGRHARRVDKIAAYERGDLASAQAKPSASSVSSRTP